MHGNTQTDLIGARQSRALDAIRAKRNAQPEKKDRLIVSAEVADDLTPYVRAALARGVTKTDLINLALAAYFEVQVFEAAV